MTLLILSAAQPPDLRKALPGNEEPVVVLGVATDLECVDRIPVAVWDSGEVEYRAVQLADKHPIRHVLATRVDDHPRAARLRSRLGLAPSPDPTLRLHDGLLSRQSLADAGLPVLPFAAVDSVEDLLAFGEPPLVIRDRFGFAAPRLLDSWADIEHWAAAWPAALDEPLGLLAEAPAHTRFQVSGVAVDGQWLWSMGCSLLSAPGAPPAGIVLAESAEALTTLADEAIRCAEAGMNGTPVSVSVELARSDGLSVVSLGPAGPAARAVAALAFGYDLDTADLRAQAGLPVTVPPAGQPGFVVGWCVPADMSSGLGLLGVSHGHAVVCGRDHDTVAGALGRHDG